MSVKVKWIEIPSAAKASYKANTGPPPPEHRSTTCAAPDCSNASRTNGTTGLCRANFASTKRR